LRRAAALADVAAHAGANDVLPGALTALAARNDVIEAQLARREFLAAELALVIVTREDVAPVELNRLLGQLVVIQQPNHTRHLDLAADSANPVVIFLPKMTGAVLAQLAPGREVV